jgi:hypothetical protein
MSIARLLCAALLGTLFGCGDRPDDRQAHPSLKEQLAEIASVKANPVTPEQVSEVFALGSDFTDLQRDLLNKELIGSVVEWRLKVYEVEFEQGLYKVTSQQLPIKSKQAVPLLRAAVLIVPSSDNDHDLMRKVKTNDMITIRGRVRDIVLRTVVVIEPALLATPLVIN